MMMGISRWRTTVIDFEILIESVMNFAYYFMSFSLQEKLQNKEAEWRETKAECLKLMRQTEEHKARGDEISRKVAMSQSRCFF
jgi:hypothetical protein